MYRHVFIVFMGKQKQYDGRWNQLHNYDIVFIHLRR